MASRTWSRIICAFRTISSQSFRRKTHSGLLHQGKVLSTSYLQRCAYSSDETTDKPPASDGDLQSSNETFKPTEKSRLEYNNESYNEIFKGAKSPPVPFLARNIKMKQSLEKKIKRMNSENLAQGNFQLGNLMEHEDVKKDLPLPKMKNPYMPEHKKCLLCQENILVDYKNPRLLSQFISPHTGRIYGRHLTGLCIPMQREVAKQIKRSRITGFMPYLYKKVEYKNDFAMYSQFKRNKRRL